MHDEIIRYSIDGEVTEENLESHKTQMVGFLEMQMRDDGVVPSLDLDPGFTLEYDFERNSYKFELSVYGIWLGKEKDLWQVAGMTNGKTIKRYTHQAKLSQS